MTILEKAIENSREFLIQRGVTVTYETASLPYSCSANLDSAEYIGTITHWPNTRFEFQFDDARSGEVAVLEEIETDEVSEICAYIRKLYTGRLEEQ